jgi:hypothetical protein
VFLLDSDRSLSLLPSKHCRTPSAKLQEATADAVEELTASGVPCKTSSAYLLLQLREQEQERPFLSHYGPSQPSAMSAPVLTQQHMFNPAAAAPTYSSSMSYAGSSELHHQYQTEAAQEQQTSSSSKKRKSSGGASTCKCKKSKCLKL